MHLHVLSIIDQLFAFPIENSPPTFSVLLMNNLNGEHRLK